MIRRRTAPTLLCTLTILASAAALSAHAQSLPQPTQEHKALQADVGTWDAITKTWMTPDSEPSTGKGTEINTLHGNMWLISRFECQMMGMKYKGHGQFGYDPVKKKYVGTWVDNISPHLTTMEGTLDKSTQTLTMISTGIDFMSRKETPGKMVTTIIDQDHKKFEMFSPVEGKKGQWWKTMEIHYTRRK